MQMMIGITFALIGVFFIIGDFLRLIGISSIYSQGLHTALSFLIFISAMITAGTLIKDAADIEEKE